MFGEESKKRRCMATILILSLFLSALFFMPISRAEDQGSEGGDLEDIISPICTEPGEQSEPDIYGNRVIWLDSREGYLEQDIYTYRFDSGSERVFSNLSSRESRASIHGDRVIWQTTNSSFQQQILLKEFGGETKNISTVPGKSESGPVLGEAYAVWQYTGDVLETRAVSYSLEDGGSKAYDRNFSSSMALSGERLVWASMDDDLTSTVHVFDLGNEGMEKEISTDDLFSTIGGGMDLKGDRLTYVTSETDEGSAIKELNLSTEETKTLVQSEGNITDMDRSGDRIVWADDRNDESGSYLDKNTDIYLFDIEEGIEVQVTADDSSQSQPAIHGDHVVWKDQRSDSSDIYGIDLTTDSDSDGTPDYQEEGTSIDISGEGEDEKSKDISPSIYNVFGEEDMYVEGVLGSICLLVIASLAVFGAIFLFGYKYLKDYEKKEEEGRSEKLLYTFISLLIIGSLLTLLMVPLTTETVTNYEEDFKEGKNGEVYISGEIVNVTKTELGEESFYTYRLEGSDFAIASSQEIGEKGDYVIIKVVENDLGMPEARQKLSPWLLMVPGIFILLDSLIFLVFYFWSGKESDEKEEKESPKEREVDQEDKLEERGAEEEEDLKPKEVERKEDQKEHPDREIY